MRRIALVGAIVLTASLTTPLPAPTAGAAGKAEFVAKCPFSHRASDDPLVHPGMPGMAHSHDFFGNHTTDAASTAASLSIGGTTCVPSADRSAYWVPTLSVGGRNIAPSAVTIYYTVENRNPQAVRPYPFGFAMIVGDARATGPSAPRVHDWSCMGVNANSATIPACPAGSQLELLVHFPDCWNGRDLDSVDHKRHVAFSVGHVCPAGFPVAIPRLEYKIHYPTRGGSTAVLSSGNGYTTHADFVNAWRPSALARRVNTCLHAVVKCGTDGRPLP